MINYLLNNFMAWNFKRKFKHIKSLIQYPIKIQNHLLKKLLTKASNSKFGKEFEFDTIKTYGDFKNRVPLVFYEDMEENIENMRNGHKNIYWPGNIKWFAMSSGTTQSKSKFIPVSKETLNDCHFKAGKDIISIYYTLYPDSKLFLGKILKLGGTHLINKSKQSYYGDLSAVLIKNLPFWAHFSSKPKLKTSLLGQWETKLVKIVNETIDENITCLAGVPSWMLVLLNKVLKTTNKKYIKEVWPNLELFVHGGVNFEPYRNQYQEIIGKKINYLEIYNASEGFFAIQNQRNPEGLLLMLNYGIFYEFIPMDKFYCNREESIIPLEKVEVGKNYALVISTNSGLWRYIVGDTVKFTRLNPFYIQVTGRTKHFINTFGEELIMENAEKAIRIASQNTQSIVKEYTAGPIYMDRDKVGRHEWVVEFSKKPKSMEKFCKEIDSALKSLNSDYEAKRYNNITIDMPKITVARPNLFYDWMKERNKLGGQNKVPRLSNDRIYLEYLLDLNTRTL